MTEFKEFLKNQLSREAGEALGGIGVHSFVTADEKTFGQLCEALSHDDATRLWGEVNSRKLARQMPAMLRVDGGTFLSPELTEEATVKFVKENPERVAKAMTSSGVLSSTDPKVREMASAVLHNLVVKELFQVVQLGKLLLARLDALEEKVQAYEARHAEEHPAVKVPGPAHEQHSQNPGKERVGEVWEQGNARAQAPIGTE